MAPRPLRLPIYRGPGAPAPTPTGQPRPHVQRLALTAMTRFQCLGSNCDANCCGHWTIPIDAAAYGRLEEVLDASGPRSLSAAIDLGTKPVGPGVPYASIHLDHDGRCPFLGSDKLCTLHAEHGEDVLSDACAVYPRTTLRIEGREEMGGRLSCPEVGRLVLLAEDGPELVPVVNSLGSRTLEGKHIAATEAEGRTLWAAAFDDVRETILAVFRRRELRLAERVVLVADLAERISPFFFKENGALEGAGRKVVERRLAKALELTKDPDLAKLLSTGLARLTIPPGPIASLIVGVLQERTRIPLSPPFNKLADEVLTGWRITIAGPDSTDDTPIDADQIGQAWLDRQALLDARHGEVVERIFRNWSLLWWTQEPYTDASNLIDHTCRFALHLATLRFLFVGHPKVSAILDAQTSADDARDELERTAVDLAMLFSRAFEHDTAFLSLIDAAICAEGPHSYARALCLARTC